MLHKAPGNNKLTEIGPDVCGGEVENKVKPRLPSVIPGPNRTFKVQRLRPIFLPKKDVHAERSILDAECPQSAKLSLAETSGFGDTPDNVADVVSH